MAAGPAHRVWAWFRGHPIVGDTLLAVAFALGSWLTIVVSGDIEGVPEPSLTTALWVSAGAIPIVIRRVHLWFAVVLTAALQVAGTLDNAAWVSLNYSIFVLAYTVAAYLSIRQALAGSAVIWGTLTVLIVTVIPEQQLGMSATSALIFNYISASILFGIGRAVYNRRRTLVELQDRAHLAEENQAAMAAQAVADERRRIARELHDVVAHHVAVMGVLATGARRVLAKDPAKADETLQTIEQTGRATLREMRRLLDVLRTSEEEPEDELTPQPGLDAVHSLVAQIRDTGLPVSLIVDGMPYPLDPGIALTVYRIIQEGLTNTLKHAGQARATVHIRYESDRIELDVGDNGGGPRVDGGGTGRVGHGLVGMRERVALYGGTLRTGPRPGGGFRVHTVIPIEASTQLLGNQQGDIT
ncbi:Histidine kinase domain-containing protein [Stackebrandtia soli]